MMNSNKDQAMAITTTSNNNNSNSSFTNTATSNNSSNTSSNNANNNNKSAEQAKGDGQPPSPPPLPAPGQLEKMPSEDNSTVFKSGPLYISSKGIGWTSWKKRWFILTRTSLVFFRSDPNAVPQKGSEVNLILGGIDLNNSGSVVVKADKKLLTVLFPDGRDGRAFTLKAETSEDLYEWKTALENALAKAPSATIVMGQNGILKNDQANVADGSQEQLKNRQPVKSLVIGRPILLALEDADGSPSFLEKALRFIEERGIKVEGILRQAADVDDVEHRIREYEQGKTVFSAEEDAHVIGDCIKYILREMPSSPVPASCCTALLEAFRTDRSNRVNAMRTAICEAFPDPNRRLLQRILLMMQAVASNKAETRMSISAAAACMAPLLLRPLLAGDCEIDTNVNVGGDSSLQLLKAAAAANHAQAIVITLLEEYNTIFREDSMTPGMYSDSEEYGSEDELVTDDDVSYEDDEDYEDDDASQGSDAYTDEDVENASSGTYSGTGDSGGDDLSETKEGDHCSSSSISSKADNSLKDEERSLSTSDRPSGHLNYDVGIKDTVDHIDDKPVELPRDANVFTALENRVTGHSLSTWAETTESDGPMQGNKRATVLGRTAARKNLSMESIDFKIDDEVDIQRLEASKLDLQKRISEEAEVNAALQANLEKRKKSLYERRIALEQDVARLQEQLQRERDKRTVLEAGLYKSKGLLLLPAATTDEKTRVDLEEITQADTDVARLKQKTNDFGLDLYQQRDHNMQNSNSQGKLNDAGAAATSQLPGRSSSKPDSCMRRADLENDKKHEATSSANRCPPQNERLVLAQKSGSRSSASTNSRRSGMRTEDISEDGNHENDKNYDSATSPNHSKNRPHDLRRRSSSKSRSSSKKCDTKTEGGSSASALTKLTTRLNFLKEKRGQIASELQNLDIGRGSGQTATGHKKTRGSEYKGKGKGLEINSAENPETGGRAESRDLDNGTGREGNSAASYVKRKKADGQSQQYTDEGRSMEDQRSK